ncbi:MAG: PDZ domain-containing protein [Deltaproteobacteria bacterium]|nr:PDZ domain-containing protein [Deltaproteobacteria bacterium]
MPRPEPRHEPRTVIQEPEVEQEGGKVGRSEGLRRRDAALGSARSCPGQLRPSRLPAFLLIPPGRLAFPCVVAALCLAVAAFGCDDLSGPWPGGIGAVLRYRARDQALVVTDVPPDSSSARAGLRQGDEVIAIDGARVADLEYRTIVQRLRGPVGTRVRLAIRRLGARRSLSIERAPYRR